MSKAVIENFYRAFARGDAEEMVSHYDAGIVFEDPAFGKLAGEDAKNMWRMLIKRGGGKLKINFENVEADDRTGSADWMAEYIYKGTGRNVLNRIHAQFEFRNGKIIKHTDQFDLWHWSRQALGWKGFLLGWTPLMKVKIQKQTNVLLKEFSKGKS